MPLLSPPGRGAKMQRARAVAGRALSSWCGREDSNFHGLPHSDLNAARLPVPPRPHACNSAPPGIPNRPAPSKRKWRYPAPMAKPLEWRPPEWRIDDAPVGYEAALAAMDARAAAIRAGTAAELVW